MEHQSHEETPGERAVKAELKHLNIKYIQEYRLNNLVGDPKNHRVADFYLPAHNVYIEFLGGWNTSEEERQRYKEKMRVYGRNQIRTIYIYPNQLHFSGKIIREGLDQLSSNPHKFVPGSKHKRKQKGASQHKTRYQNEGYSQNTIIMLMSLVIFLIISAMFFSSSLSTMLFNEPVKTQVKQPSAFRVQATNQCDELCASQKGTKSLQCSFSTCTCLCNNGANSIIPK